MKLKQFNCNGMEIKVTIELYKYIIERIAMKDICEVFETQKHQNT